MKSFKTQTTWIPTLILFNAKQITTCYIHGNTTELDVQLTAAKYCQHDETMNKVSQTFDCVLTNSCLIYMGTVT